MSFKLLAIRPLPGCNPKFLKNLEEGRIYKFYSDYTFYNEEDKIDTINYEIGIEGIKDITTIKHEITIPENLYYQGEDSPIKINISAIVGKNGSGKSALTELLIVTIVKLSLEINDDFIIPYYSTNEKKAREQKNEFVNSKKIDLNNINVELVFLCKVASVSRIRKIRLKNGEVDFLDFEKHAGTNTFKIPQNKEETSIKDLNHSKINKNKKLQLSLEELIFFKDFFYTITVNYSHYSFNSNELGEWLRGVFHKNDGYQLPVVVTPFRESGNIDINSEKDLAVSRFLVNILQLETLRNISENKRIKYVSIEINTKKFSWNSDKNLDKRISNSPRNRDKYVRWVLEEFYENQIIEIKYENFLYPYVRDYILYKLIRITNYSVYEDFKNCFRFTRGRYSISDEKLFKEYIKALSNDSSHNTDKLRQSIFFLKYLYLNKQHIYQENINEKLISVDELYIIIKKAYEKYVNEIKLTPIEKEIFIPEFSIRESLPSIFKVNYYFDNKISHNNFDNFSSGEKQKIFSIHSVIYHLRNINSVKAYWELEINNTLIKKAQINYTNINVIFDEIELYAHPEYQRKFIKDFIDALQAVYKKSNIHNLNIIFITHSPFILSDIPKQNVLFLDSGQPQEYKSDNTFAENIHEMLTDGFFMGNTKGGFSISKINEFLADYNDYLYSKENCFEQLREKFISNRDNYILLINMIGEEYIRKILENQLDELNVHFKISPSKNDLKDQEALLLEQLNLIRKQLGNE